MSQTSLVGTSAFQQFLKQVYIHPETVIQKDNEVNIYFSVKFPFILVVIGVYLTLTTTRRRYVCT